MEKKTKYITAGIAAFGLALFAAPAFAQSADLSSIGTSIVSQIASFVTGIKVFVGTILAFAGGLMCFINILRKSHDPHVSIMSVIWPAIVAIVAVYWAAS